MTSGRENYEHNQLIYRRREAYDQHHMLEQELKSLRAELHTLDDKLKQSHPNEIADVLHHMGRIGFIQSELDGTSLDKEAEAFANNELGIRFDTLFEKLRAMAKVGGMDWKLREEKTQRLYSVQQSLIKKQDEIINLDHAYFSSIEYNEQYATTPPPPVDDDVFEKWIEQSQLTEKEIHDYDREAWADEKQWMEISAEAQERALEELRQQNVDAEAFEERMKAAMRLETEIEGIRQKLQSSVRRLQNVQQARKKTIQQRIDLQDAVKMKEAEYNSQIAELEDFFDMIVDLLDFSFV